MTYRCPACRTRRATFTGLLKHVQDSGHRLCDCGAYHYPHRPRGGYCHQHEKAGLRAAARYGIDGDELLDIAADVSWDSPGHPGLVCPF